MSALRAAPAPAGPLCAGCLSRPPAYLRAIVAFDYEPPGVALIGQLKTRLRLSLAPVLARLLGRPSPGRHPACRCGAGRRTGQPGLAASARHEPGHGDRPQPATALDLPLRPGALLRLRETPRQAGLGRRERRAALAGVFRGQGVRGRHVALVDDVMTTGSTAEAAAQACWRPARSA